MTSFALRNGPSAVAAALLGGWLALSSGALAQTTVRIVSGQASQNGDVLRTIFDEFNAREKDVRIKLELDNKSDLDTTQKVLADIAAGSPPDAVRVTGAVLRAYVDSGRAQPLDACLASAANLSGQLNKDLIDSARVKGKLYVMPWYVTLPGLFINVNAFKAAGLDPAHPPRTWSELEAAAAKLSDPKANRFGVLMYMPNTYLFESQLESAGGEMVGSDGKAAVAGPQGVAVMEFMRGLVKKGYMPAVAPGAFWGQFASLFRSGNLGMLMFSASTYPSLARNSSFPIDLAPMPIKDDGSVVATASINGFVMLATNPTRQAATCKALLSLLTPQSVARTVKATATVPLNNVATTTPALLGDYYKANPQFLAVNAQHSGAWYSMPGPRNTEFLKDFGDAQYEVLTGAASAKDGLAKLTARMNELLTEQ